MVKKDPLDYFVGDCKKKALNFLGYPVNLKSNLNEYYEWFIKNKVSDLLLNNVGDPFEGIDSTYSLNSNEVERIVIQTMATLYDIPSEDVWGIVTTSGTDGNNHGLYFGSKSLLSKTGMLPIVYVSKEAHYSVRRLCDLQNLECRIIEIDEFGRMSPEDLRRQIDPTKPVLINFAIGSTFMGAIDDQDAINKVIEEVNPIAVYRHLDAALFGAYLPFTAGRDIVSMKKHKYDSIAISGHKFYGLDEPCGLFFCTKKLLEEQKHYKVEYLNTSMPMISCSRNGLNPIKFYFVGLKQGEEALRVQTFRILELTEYLQRKFNEIGYPAWHNKYSNTVFFKRPSEYLIKKYALAGGYNERYGGDLNHIVVMQHSNKQVIDQFLEDLKQSLKK